MYLPTPWPPLASCALSLHVFPTDVNAPVCTIDVGKLKESHFLFLDNGKPVLPYRDENGMISVRLLEEGNMKLKKGLVKVPDSVLCHPVVPVAALECAHIPIFHAGIPISHAGRWRPSCRGGSSTRSCGIRQMARRGHAGNGSEVATCGDRAQA